MCQKPGFLHPISGDPKKRGQPKKNVVLQKRPLFLEVSGSDGRHWMLNTSPGAGGAFHVFHVSSVCAPVGDD